MKRKRITGKVNGPPKEIGDFRANQSCLFCDKSLDEAISVNSSRFTIVVVYFEAPKYNTSQFHCQRYIYIAGDYGKALMRANKYFESKKGETKPVLRGAMQFFVLPESQGKIIEPLGRVIEAPKGQIYEWPAVIRCINLFLETAQPGWKVQIGELSDY